MPQIDAVTHILNLFELRLKNISKANGYFSNIHAKSILRASLKTFEGYDLPAINYWPDELKNTTNEYGSDTRTFGILVEFYSMTRDRPFTDVCNELAFDLMTAVHRSESSPKVSDLVSLDLDGEVESLDFSGYTYQLKTGQAPWCGILASFTVTFFSDTGMM